MISPTRYPWIHQVSGIDFSGAAEAGLRLWVASGTILTTEAGRLLEIEDCSRGDALPGSGRSREACLDAVRALIAQAPHGAFGCDFPFGLPRSLVGEPDWPRFALAFADRYRAERAEDFRQRCLHEAAGRYLRRRCDDDARAPFCPYNLRIFRQTFHGIRDVLAPLVRDQLIAVPPAQPLIPGRAIVLESCPASTLKREGLYRPYKGKTVAHQAQRSRIVDWLRQSEQIRLDRADLLATLVDDPGGDALDSVIAAFATFRNLTATTGFERSESDYAIECFIYS